MEFIRINMKSETLSEKFRDSSTGHLLLAGFIVVLTIIVYAQCLNVPLLFDDFRIIERNPAIRDLPGLLTLKNVSSRPFVDLTLALNYAAGKQSPFGYHAVSLIIHLLNGLILYLLTSRLLLAVRNGGAALPVPSGITVAFLAAGIFLLHPVQTQPVIYICQRYTLFAAFFYMLSVYCFVNARLLQRSGCDAEQGKIAGFRAILWFSAAMVSGGLAFLSKQNAASLPLMLFVVELLLFCSSWRSVFYRVLFLIAGVVGVAAIYILLKRSELHSLNEFWGVLDRATRETTSITRRQYFLTQLHVIWEYIRMIIWPSGLTIEHAYQFRDGLLDVMTVIAGIGHLTVITVAVGLRKKIPVITLGVIWFYIGLSVESSLIPIRDAMVDHRMYLPLAGVSWAAAYLTVCLLQFYSASRRMVFCVMVGIFFVYAGGAFIQGRVWRSPSALWSDSLSKNAVNPKALSNLGLAYERNGQIGMALKYYKKAMSLSTDFHGIATNIGLIYGKQGKYTLAISYLEKAVQNNSRADRAIGTLGLIYLKQGNEKKALQYFKRADQINPYNPTTLYNLGLLYLKHGDYANAFFHFNRLVSHFPENNPKVYYFMGYIQEQVGEKDSAAIWRAKSIRYGMDVKTMKYSPYGMKIDISG